jgi:hypothetical protein
MSTVFNCPLPDDTKELIKVFLSKKQKIRVGIVTAKKDVSKPMNEKNSAVLEIAVLDTSDEPTDGLVVCLKALNRALANNATAIAEFLAYYKTVGVKQVTTYNYTYTFPAVDRLLKEQAQQVS